MRAAAIAQPGRGPGVVVRPRSSVLGEAMDAIDAGRHLMIFSDNVPVADEVAIKQRSGRGQRAGHGARTAAPR